MWREPRFTRPEHLVLLSLGIVAAAVAAAAMHRTLLPLVSPERIVGDSRRSSRHLVALEREKRLVLRSIKELEFDKAMGKVADADFDEMAGRLRQRAVGLMQRIELGEAGLRERIVEGPGRPQAAEGRRSKVSAQQCAACKTLNDADARFCKTCGADAVSGRAHVGRARAGACTPLASCWRCAGRSAQMPDLRQMNGMALPSPDLPDGAVSVRVVKQTLGNNVVGTTVTVAGDGVSDSAPDRRSGPRHLRRPRRRQDARRLGHRAMARPCSRSRSRCPTKAACA